MVNVTSISPKNEMDVAERLAAEIRRLWPAADGNSKDRIDLMVGVRNGTDIDLLIAVDLESPRQFSGGSDGWIQYALIAVEIKQLDPTGFEQIGNAVFAIYDGVREQRSVADQAREAALAARRFAQQSGFYSTYVYAAALLTNVDAQDLIYGNVDPIVIGRQAGWFGILSACARQRRLLPDDDGEVDALRDGMRAVRERVLTKRQFSALDRTKASRIANDIIVRNIITAIAPHAGKAFIRIAGRGGSGKTVALVLLAKRLAALEGARVLILTFHHALRGDIEHLFAAMPDAQPMLGDRISVQTATSFLTAALEQITGAVPVLEDGRVDYERLTGAFRLATEALKGGSEGDIATMLRDTIGGTFDWDHVLIDEAQDWSDAERDLLRGIYGHQRLIIADGMEQLVNRQTPCDWLKGVPRREIVKRTLGDSLRMQGNIAMFVNAFAGAAGFADWKVNPHDEMPGGRIIIATGGDPQTADLVRALNIAAKAGKADPVDCLICVPPTNAVRGPNRHKHAGFADVVLSAGGISWDAVDLATRTTPPSSTHAWRIVPYDSCRGLEGWITLLLDFDQLYMQKLRYPNYHHEDRPGDDALVARRWLLIPLTRAVNTLVITIRDEDSPVVAILREASRAMPTGVVQWCSAAECASRVSTFPATT